MAPADSKPELVGLPSQALPGAIPQLLLPNLAAMLAVVTLAYCLYVSGGTEQLFRDSDSGWHIRSGEWILAHGALPTGDPYSFSKAGQPWFLWEWGSDVLIGLAHRLDGLRGVTALFGLVIFACTWLCCRLQLAVGGDFFLTAVFTAPIITTASLHWLARPHVFSWVFLLIAVSYAEQGRPRSPWRHLLLIAGFTALWANVHASFFLAPAIALIYAVSHGVRLLLWPLDASEERADARWYLSAALAGLAGSFLNPYGWRLHAHIFTYLRDEDLTARVAEFQSFNFHDKGALQIVLVVALAGTGTILALTQKKVAHFLLASAFLWEGLRSARMLPVVALVILPLANGALSEALRSVENLRPPLHRALHRVFRYSSRLRRIDHSVNGWGFSLCAVLLLLLALKTPALAGSIGFPRDRFPVQAAAAVEKLTADARILAPDSFGGYLIYRFDGSRKVYFDGRSDFYGVEFMKHYLTLMSVQSGWRDVMHSYGFTHALVPTNSALKAALDDAGWATLSSDPVATLLEAR